MANRSSPNCKCRQGQGDAVKKSQQLGLDELMIVNPGPPGAGPLFLGEDGTLYQVQGLGQEEDLRGLGQFLLGEDEPLDPGRFFLGEDGTLYEVIS